MEQDQALEFASAALSALADDEREPERYRTWYREALAEVERLSARPDPTGASGVDGTPGWAYGEDGYCVCCGSGRWKHHMPECELRDGLDARAIVRDLAATEDVTNWPAEGVPVCVFCRTWNPGYSEPHKPSCPWRRAREATSSHETGETGTDE